MYENMTIGPYNYTKEAGWGNTSESATANREILSPPLSMHHLTIILQRLTKLLNSLHASLFDLLPSGILRDIDICLSVLKHRDKFKHVILRFKYMSNPVLFPILYKFWTSYHNFRALCWYNQVKYNWEYIHLLARDDGNWKHYDYYMNTYKYITHLTPELLRHRELCKLLKKFSQDENSSIPYFKQKIPYSNDKNHIERSVP